jgi:uncharacterized protein (TIGR02118 family)
MGLHLGHERCDRIAGRGPRRTAARGPARGGVAAPSASYRTAELWFDSVEDADACVRSNDRQTWMADFPNFATGGVTLLVTETE